MEALRPSSAIAYHSQLSTTWEQRYRKRSFRARQIVLAECLTGRRVGGNWLDAGCATGTLSRWLSARGCTVLGLDASRQMIEQAIALPANRAAGNLQFQRGSITQLQLGAELLDGILCSSVLEYVADPELCLAEFSRVLKPSGLLLVSVPNRNSYLRKIQRFYHRAGAAMGFAWAEFMEYSMNHYSAKEFEKVLAGQGFAVDKIVPFGSGLPRAAQRNGRVGSLLMFVASKIRYLAAMKQLLQNANTGEVEVMDVPSPALLPGCVLVRIAASVVSAGTERASSAFASKGLLKKAIARPDLAQEVISKIRRDGLFSAAAAVRGRLDQPGAPGYSSAGIVIAVSSDVTDIQVGDRVACAGAGYAVHAQFACVPRLLLARIPANVGFEEAAFTTLGAIALHGMRVAEVKLADTVAVIGLGLLGQLTVQLLKAAGCHVLGMDVNPARADLALSLGADGAEAFPENFYDLCLQRTSGCGADAVLITAETASSAPVNLAAKIARDRAVITAVGTVGMDFQRKHYFEKELDFRISRSYGPGRYDTAYEQKGRDYPIGYVRWTETRNMEAFLALLAEEKLQLQPLISHRFPIERAPAAYELITGRREEPFLGVLITYPEPSTQSSRLDLKEKVSPAAVADCVSVGVLGAGNFALNTLLPAMKRRSGTRFAGICSANGSHARHAAKKFGFQFCATDENEILNNPAVNTIVIATRHHLHHGQVIKAHHAGKHVFCEKPLCLNERELAAIIREYSDRERKPNRPLLMVGFNRRFAPMARELKSFLQQINEPLALHYRINAGPLSPDHWTNDPEQGGGRILGEVCHFVDLLSFLSGSLPIEVHTRDLTDGGKYSGDNVVLSLAFANGSLGTITYIANGDRSFSKERLEVFGGGCAAVLEDFRRLELVRHGKKKIFRSRLRQDKGHRDEWAAFVSAIRSGGPSPISFEEIVSTTLVTFGAMQSRCLGSPIEINTAEFVAESLPDGYLAQEPVGT